MGWFRRGGEQAPRAEGTPLQLEPGERVLARGVDEHTGAELVLTTWALVLRRDGQVVTRRPWSDVDAGSWAPRSQTMSVTWVDGSAAGQWLLGPAGDKAAEVFRDRVQASVVLSDDVLVDGRSVGRAAIRKDLATGRLFGQVVVARGVRRDDPRVAAQADAVLADLREQTGAL